MSDEVGVARIDGRTARALRTREAIVAAHLELLRSGDLRPTGERIAEAAGVSLRTLWTSFKDMETLFAAAGEHLIDLQQAAYRAIALDLPLAERITAFCEQRAAMLEILAPAARAAMIREPFSAQLRRNRAIQIGRVRDEIESLFGPELTAAGDDRQELRDALLMATTYAAWAVLREHLDLDAKGATAVMRRTIAALLGDS